MNNKFTLENAEVAYQEGLILPWIINYLKTQGNNPDLASRIERAELKVVELRPIPFSKFSRIIGPEEGMIFPETIEVFNDRIAKLVTAIERGENFPPLVVTDFWKLGTIQDGAHRFEALKKSGYDSYPAVVLFEKLESCEWLDEKQN